MGKKIDLTGQRFGRLVVVKKVIKRIKKRNYSWLCKCDCGIEKIVFTEALTEGKVRSCGCLQKEVRSSNGEENIKKAYDWAIDNDIKEGTRLTSISKKEPNKGSKSGVRGVSWDEQTKQWRAQLTIKGRSVLYKRFPSKQDAINARKEAEEKHFQPILEKYGKESK